MLLSILPHRPALLSHWGPSAIEHWITSPLLSLRKGNSPSSSHHCWYFFLEQDPSVGHSVLYYLSIFSHTTGPCCSQVLVARCTAHFYFLGYLNHFLFPSHLQPLQMKFKELLHCFPRNRSRLSPSNSSILKHDCIPVLFLQEAFLPLGDLSLQRLLTRLFTTFTRK
jgi:hypothetical protein